MSENLTRVELFYLEGQVNYWIKFGEFTYDKNIDRRCAFVWFKPYQTFCYIRWWANEYGTQGWTLAILCSTTSNDYGCQTYPGIHPNADVLLQVSGRTYVKRILDILNDIEEQEIELADVSPNYYHYLAQCILTNQQPHLYNEEQHNVFQKLVGRAI